MSKILSAILVMLMLVCGSASAETRELVVTNPKGKKVATFKVEVAVDEVTRARGLMHREHLKPGHGMLFVFPLVGVNAFWMKNTLIPLDMIFINPDGSIRMIHPMAEPNSRKIIKSGGPVKAGLEINGGEAQKMGLKPGYIVHDAVFGNELEKP